MVRPRRVRRVSFQPDVTYFKPRGIPLGSLEEEILSYEEIESVRLVDFEGIEQEKAAKQMKISQPTLSRLIENARRKIAKAIIKGKAIKIEGGNYRMVQSRGRGFGVEAGFRGPATTCVCPDCGYKESKPRGIPCITRKCPKCKGQMMRG